MMKFVMVALTLALSAAFAAEESKAKNLSAFTTTHVPTEDNWHFVFPAGEARAYYADARLGLKIESVSADGVALPVRVTEGQSGHISQRVYSPLARTGMVYRLMRAQFMFMISGDPDGELKIGTYQVPMSAKRIEIVYRVRYPSGEISSEFTLVSLSSYEFLPRR